MRQWSAMKTYSINMKKKQGVKKGNHGNEITPTHIININLHAELKQAN